MSIKAHIQDISRVVSVTPPFDVTGQLITAHVYKDGDYMGVAKTVKPDVSSAVKMNISNNGGGLEAIRIRVLAKLRYQENYTEVANEFINIEVGTGDYEVRFDQEDKINIRVEFSDVGANLFVNSFNVESKQYTSIEGLVVGGEAGVEVAVPCDFRGFEPGDEYSLVFVAENYGVLAKEILIIYDGGGYGFEVE